jgi:predicted histidine transporter YuiF (NhaC family)
MRYKLKSKRDLVALVLVAKMEEKPVKRRYNGKLVHDCLLLLQIKKPANDERAKQTIKQAAKIMEIFITLASIIIAYVLFVRKDRKQHDNAETHFQHKQQLKQRQWKNQHQS